MSAGNIPDRHESSESAQIESLNHDGRGVTHVDGKVVYVDGALPGEEVRFRYLKKRRRFDEGEIETILSESPERVSPKCKYFGICGGCSLQHLSSSGQLTEKEQVLLGTLRHVGNVVPDEVLPALESPPWGYRHKARLGVRYVRKKGRVLVGFREKRHRYLADMSSCEVLHPTVGPHLGQIAEVTGNLEIKGSIAQIEVAAGENVTALVFRNLEEPTPSDKDKLVALGAQMGWKICLQPAGIDSVYSLDCDQQWLNYQHPKEQITIQFDALDFTQVNFPMNRKMIPHVLGLLDLVGEDKVLDLFCGIGNFTLPIARYVSEVVGIEGSEALVEKGRANAKENQISNAAFYKADLFSPVAGSMWEGGDYTKLLIDPPRSGAMEVVQGVDRIGVNRIVYVSCNPATLARDAGILVHDHGYRLQCAGVMDMFPHTSHVEAVALFNK